MILSSNWNTFIIWYTFKSCHILIWWMHLLPGDVYSNRLIVASKPYNVHTLPFSHWMNSRILIRNLSQAMSMANPKPSGFSNTKAGKVAILERTKTLVDKSSIVSDCFELFMHQLYVRWLIKTSCVKVITVPIEGVSKEDTDFLRKALPKTTTASVVKNAIFKKVIEGTQFEPLSKSIRDETMYLFVPEGDAKKTYDAYKKWQKDFKRFVFFCVHLNTTKEFLLKKNREQIILLSCCLGNAPRSLVSTLLVHCDILIFLKLLFCYYYVLSQDWRQVQP